MAEPHGQGLLARECRLSLCVSVRLPWRGTASSPWGAPCLPGFPPPSHCTCKGRREVANPSARGSLDLLCLGLDWRRVPACSPALSWRASAFQPSPALSGSLIFEAGAALGPPPPLSFEVTV